MRILNLLFIFLIKIYQIVVSPLLGRRCRYYPSCSEYALLSFQRYFFFKAFFLSTVRILKCNPLFHGGVDFPCKEDSDKGRK